MREVEIRAGSTGRFASVLSEADRRRLDDTLRRIGRCLDGWRLVHVSSTATGGGVAELLATISRYERGADVDVRWLVIDGDDDFFTVTKRIHNFLHENDGDGGGLGPPERATYDAALARAANDVCRVVTSGDVVVLHDPQTAGLVPSLKERGASVVWRCHVGVDAPGPRARHAWDFLRDDVEQADVVAFSRPAFVWSGLPRSRVVIWPPCIDALAPKNQPLDERTVAGILAAAGIVPADGPEVGPPGFVRTDDTQAKVALRAELIEIDPVPSDARVVTQVSRWDALKDPVGVLRGFCLDGVPVAEDTHLVLAGPSVDAVSDDPEGASMLEQVRGAWEQLPPRVRSLVHIACVPMDDVEENGAVVNALQRHSDVVVQKSIAEGFGLTVAEAMWKARPVVASRVGGIQDQIVDGESGVLLDAAEELAGFHRAVAALLDDPDRARRLGRQAAVRVRDLYLPVNHYLNEAELLERVLA